MRFILDEGLPCRLATHLRAIGHDVTAVGHDYPYALADRDILAIVTAERRIVLTDDKDFGDLIFRDRLAHEGVTLFRLGYAPLDVWIALLRRRNRSSNARMRVGLRSRGCLYRACRAMLEQRVSN